MTDYEEKQEFKDIAMKAAFGFACALGGVAWQIARSVIVDRGIRAAHNAIDKWVNKDKTE